MPRCTVLDEEMVNNANNDHNILPPLFVALQRHYPRLANELSKSGKSSDPSNAWYSIQETRAHMLTQKVLLMLI